jgi:hypothetical protein
VAAKLAYSQAEQHKGQGHYGFAGRGNYDAGSHRQGQDPVEQKTGDDRGRNYKGRGGNYARIIFVHGE